jgi:hypothetical protein
VKFDETNRGSKTYVWFTTVRGRLMVLTLAMFVSCSIFLFLEAGFACIGHL